MNVTDFALGGLHALIISGQPVSQPSSCPEDVGPGKGDGLVNIDDLLQVISAWGTCP